MRILKCAMKASRTFSELGEIDISNHIIEKALNSNK